MTTLEITLLVSLIYLIIGIITYLFKPEEHYMFHEKFVVVMDIFLWPIVVIRLISDAITDSFDL
jgi:hypothetical protein